MSTRTGVGTTSTILVIVVTSGAKRPSSLASRERVRARGARVARVAVPVGAATCTAAPGASAARLACRGTPWRPAWEERGTAPRGRPPCDCVEEPATDGGVGSAAAVGADAVGAGVLASGAAVSVGVLEAFPGAAGCADRASLAIGRSCERAGSVTPSLPRAEPFPRPEPCLRTGRCWRPEYC